MQDTFAKVRPAIDFSSDDFGFVVVQDGIMYGTNGNLSAAAPYESDIDFKVSATALDKFLRQCPNPKAKLTNKSLILEGGKLKARLSLVEKDVHWLKPGEGYECPLEPGFLDALRVTKDFVGESHIYKWRCGVASTQGKLWATNGNSMIEYDYNGLSEYLIPVRVVEYLLKRKDEPVKFLLGNTFVAYFYADGSWVRAMREAEEKLENMPSILDKLYKHPTKEIPEETKKLIIHAVESGSEDITIDPNQIYASLSGGHLDIESENQVETESSWTTKNLELVMRYATHMHFDPDDGNDKQPASFRGEKVRGMIMRREKVCERQSADS